MDAPSGFAAEVFDVMMEVMQQPAFSPSDVELAKREQVAGIIASEESAMGLAGRELRPFIFKGHYAHRPSGLAKDVAKYAPADLASFWQQQSAMPWVLSIAGDFSREEALRFASLVKKPSRPSMQLPDAAWGGDRSLVKTLPGRDQAVYMMLFPTVGYDAPDRQAVRLLSMALDGFTGMLYQELREKQSLGYSVFPIDWATKKAGFLGFGIVATPQNLDKARASFIEVANAVREKLFAVETLDRAKAVAEANYSKSRQSRISRVGDAAANVLNGKPLDHTWKKMQELMRVSAEDVRNAAKKYIVPERCYELTVRP